MNFEEPSNFPPEPSEFEQEVDKVGSWSRLSRRVPYRNKWIQVEHHEVKDPSGAPGVYGVVHFFHRALGCVPLHEDGTVTLVGQHRYPIDQWSWEIPEGGGRLDTEPLAEMQRELLEETGLRASEWIEMGMVHTSNSVCDESAQLWLAKGLTQGVATPDSTEDIRLMRVPLQEAMAMALDGRITDALTLCALFRVQSHLGAI